MKKIIAVLIITLSIVVFGFSQGFDFGGFGDFGGMVGGMSGMGGNENYAKARAKADDAMDKMGGRIALRFYNALNRNPIPDAVVNVANVGSFRTGQDGKIVFPSVQDGNYTLIFTKEGFITTTIEFRVLIGAVDLNWFNISPGIPNTSYRLVLEWGENPADLDMHFVKTGGSGNYHISYYNMKKAEDGNAVLDRDDTAGYGPETITIGKIDMNASYVCYVHDYTNRNNSNSRQMPQNGAVLRLYSENRLLKTFRIPSNGAGTRWNVFTIDRGLITDVNTVTSR